MGYNVQVAVDTEHHLIVTHEVTNVGSDRAQLAHMAKQTKTTLEAANLDVVADRGYFNSDEILKCDKAGITVTLPKPMTSTSNRFRKHDFRYVAEDNVYICPAGERLGYSFTTQEHGLVLHRYMSQCLTTFRYQSSMQPTWSEDHAFGAGNIHEVVHRPIAPSIRRRCVSGGRPSNTPSVR